MRMDTHELNESLERINARLNILVRIHAEDGAKKMESYAKGNHKWQNRTGEAERTLRGFTQPLPNGYRIIISHGVWYGVWLELAHAKKYGIIPDTIRYVGEMEILPRFEQFLEEMR